MLVAVNFCLFCLWRPEHCCWKAFVGPKRHYQLAFSASTPTVAHMNDKHKRLFKDNWQGWQIIFQNLSDNNSLRACCYYGAISPFVECAPPYFIEMHICLSHCLPALLFSIQQWPIAPCHTIPHLSGLKSNYHFNLLSAFVPQCIWLECWQHAWVLVCIVEIIMWTPSHN